MPTVQISRAVGDDPALTLGTTAEAARPVLIATDEDFVWLANFAEVGLSHISAFAVLDVEIGLKVMIDERLPLDARSGIINAALRHLIDRMPERFALIDANGKPFGGAA